MYASICTNPSPNRDRMTRSAPAPRPFAPRADIRETDHAYGLTLEVPGFAPEQIQVSFEKERLLISGDAPEPAPQEGTVFHRLERSTGGFERAFRLPREVDISHAEAIFDLGLLEITLPKRAEAQRQHIEIRARPRGAAPAETDAE